VSLGLVVCLSIGLAILCSEHGVGLSPQSLHWWPGRRLIGVEHYPFGYYWFLWVIDHVGHDALPAAARWPQILLFALTVIIGAATIWRRSDRTFYTATAVALLITLSPQVLRTFTILTPEALVAFLVTLCFLTAEEYGRSGRRIWFCMALLLLLITASCGCVGLALIGTVRMAIDSAKNKSVAWGHLLFAGFYALVAVTPWNYGFQPSFWSCPVIVTVAIFLGSAVRTPKAAWLLILMVIGQSAFAIPWIIHAERDGHDFAERQWKHSLTIQTLSRLTTNPIIYSNLPEPVLHYTNLTVAPIPEEARRHPLDAATDWDDLQHTLTNEDSLVVLFGDSAKDLADVSKRVPLEGYRTLPDGEILRADASAWVGGKRTPPFSDKTPSIPARRSAGHLEWWNKRHDDYVKQATGGNIGLLFLGDSITDDFRKVPGAWDLFQERFGKYHAANFGIDRDRTQHLLFRILNGECDHIHPRVAVILIGTNNTADDSAASIAKGIGACVAAVSQKLPQTRILLLGLFPRGGSATDNDKRPVIQAVNRQIARLDNGDTVRFLNLYDKFLAPDGSLSKQIMYDGLHPSLQGYHIWLDAMQPLLEQMMRLPPATVP
jgi:beta-glucosidase